MKKTKNKPKLKKYRLGGPSGTYNPADPDRLLEDTNSGTNTISTGQYIGAGTKALSGASQAYSVSNSGMNQDQKENSYKQIASSTGSSIASMVPVYGQIFGTANSMTKQAEKAIGQGTNTMLVNPKTNETVYKKGAEAGLVEGIKPTHESQIENWVGLGTGISNGNVKWEDAVGSVLPVGSFINAAEATWGKDKYSEAETEIAKQQKVDQSNQDQYNKMVNYYNTQNPQMKYGGKMPRLMKYPDGGVKNPFREKYVDPKSQMYEPIGVNIPNYEQIPFDDASFNEKQRVFSLGNMTNDRYIPINTNNKEYGNPNNSFERQAYNEYLRKQQLEQSGLPVKYSLPGINTYSNGGFSGENPNAELEKQEVVQTPQGEIDNVNGPSHENGGVPVNIPEGTRILSDKLKMPGTKKTFAKLGKPYTTTKEDKVLSDDNLSSISKHTAELMKQVKNQKTNELFNIQESMKAQKLQNYAKKLGMDSNSFKFGGEYSNDPSNMKQPYNDSLSLYNHGIQQMKDWNYVPNEANAIPGEDIPWGGDPKFKPEKYYTTTNHSGEKVYYAYYKKPVGNLPTTNGEFKKNNLGNSEYIDNKGRQTWITEDEFNKKSIPKHGNGGKQLPKYPWGTNGQWIKPRQETFANPNEDFGYTPSLDENVSLKLGPNGEQQTYYNPQKFDLNSKNYNVYSGVNQNYRSNGSIPKDLNNQPTIPQPERNSFNWQQAGDASAGLANLAGPIYGLMTNKKQPTVQPKLLNPKYINANEALKSEREDYLMNKKDINSIGQGNTQQIMSNYILNKSKSTQDRAKMLENVDNANAATYNRADEGNVANRMATDDINRRNEAAYRNMNTKYVGDAGNIMASNYRDYKTPGMDQKSLAMISAMYPGYQYKNGVWIHKINKTNLNDDIKNGTVKAV